MSRDGYLPPGVTQQMCDEAQPGYWDEPDYDLVLDKLIAAADDGDDVANLILRLYAAMCLDRGYKLDLELAVWVARLLRRESDGAK